MKKFLLASAAALLAGTSAIALDGAANPVVEVRGSDGSQTLHISDGATDTRIRIGGQTVEIHDGVVIVDGERIELGDAEYVVIDGDDVRVVEGSGRGFYMEFANHHAMATHMAGLAENLNHTIVASFDGDFEFDFDHAEFAEMAEELAEMEIHLGELETMNFEAVHADALRSMEEALANLDEGHVTVDGRDWDELSDEEKEEVREELREAREEMRLEFREMREEMREASREMRHAERERERALRHTRREVERARHRADREHRRESEEERRERHEDMRERAEERRAHIEERRAHAEERRAHAEERREQARRMRVHAERARNVIRERFGDDASVRIEEDGDGNRRVWVDGEEQTGDDLTNWLNQLEADRLDGGN